MVQLEHNIVVQHVVLIAPVSKPGIVHQEGISTLQHHVSLLLGEEEPTSLADVKQVTHGIIGCNPVLIPLGASRVLIA